MEPQPPLLIWNTMDRRKVPFQPIQPNHVGLYSCGPTVYNYVHLGNMRAYLFVDTLRRVLEYRGYSVKHVMNITDVGHLTDDADSGDDKLALGAAREGKTAWDVARFYEAAFFDDIDKLNIERAAITPRATEHIPQQIALIETLEQRGFTYRTDDGVYFDTAKLPDYGKLARLNEQELRAGARVDINHEKRHPQDFALWKFSKPDERRHMEWPSPWGKGFPGWHIECSAMSVAYLGQPFDIHTGGIDHIPIHHTNEIAQSEAAFRKPLANYWLHNDFLQEDGGKMAKSAGTFLRLQTVIDRGYDPLAFRYLALGTHYRHPLNFTWDALDAAANGLKNLQYDVRRLVGTATTVPPELDDAFLRAISDDLNTAQALALLQETVKRADLSDEQKLAAVAAWDTVLGLQLLAAAAPIPADVLALFGEYQAARAAKDFTVSDRIRGELAARGYHVEDTANGSRILPE